MSLTENQMKTLQKIIDLNGSCLDAELCTKCPFNNDCLPNFIKIKATSTMYPILGDTKVWSKKKRVATAAAALTHFELLEDI